MTIIPLDTNYENSLWVFNEVMRRAVDGTVNPFFLDVANQRIIIGGTSSLGSNAPLQVQSGDIEVTTAGKGIILKDDGGTGKTCRITSTWSAPDNNWTLTLTTIS